MSESEVGGRESEVDKPAGEEAEPELPAEPVHQPGRGVLLPGHLGPAQFKRRRFRPVLRRWRGG